MTCAIMEVRHHEQHIHLAFFVCIPQVVVLTLEYTCTARDLRVLGCDDLGTVVEAI